MENKTKISGTIEIEIAGIKYSGAVELTEAPRVTANKPQYKAWGVRIDRENSDPEEAVEYISKAAGYMPADGTEPGSWADNPVFAKIKPCLLCDGKVVDYLDPNDYGRTADGEPIGKMRAYFDTMVEFGKIFYRIRKDERYTYVEITDDARSLADGFTDYAFSYKGKVRDKFYIGAYKGCVENGKLRAISGVMPTTNKTIGDFRKAAQANGNGYEITPFNKLTLLQALYIVRFKSLDSRAALGKGYTEASAYSATGKTDKDGLYFGNQDGERQVKCHGIEDFWGNVFEWVDGFVTTDKIKIADGNFNNNGDGYEIVADLPNTVCGAIIDIHGDNKLGFVPKEADDNLCAGEAYYCNYGSTWCDGTVNLPSFGGVRSSGASAGAFYFSCSYSASLAYASLGARLCFCGNE